MTGTVFNIQNYSLHDGPGIRTVVFLKGCPLRCIWCSNPESQETFQQAYFDSSKCIFDKGCKMCSEVCSADAFSGGCLDISKCSDSIKCAELCPAKAVGIYGRQMTAQEVVDNVERESAFYSHGNGGITLSGGEPFMQGEFALEILKLAKKQKINTAVETCGCCDKQILREAAGLLDNIMFDVKMLDEKKHIKYTGVSNKRILENLEMLFEEFPHLHKCIRTPVIPTVNDNESDIKAIVDLLKGRSNYHYELLPYHRFGQGKYKLLGREYPNLPDRLDESKFQKLISLTK